MKRILIVDDREDNLYLLSALLTGHGYEVQQARNGSEALTLTQANTPDMIISDILMPEMDGFTFCRIIKKDERLKQVPFIFYTATYTDPKDEKLALDMGASAFIIKPTEPDEFMRRIEEILSSDEEGKLSMPQKQTAETEVVLKEYNEVLIRKLEQKMLKLEEVNKALEVEIAARKQVEDALQESEERYRLLFENSMDAILLTQPNGIILKANPAACRIFGRCEEEICQSGRSGIIDSYDPRLPRAIEERERTGKFIGELTGLRKDGTRFPCELSSAIFKDAEGKLQTSMIIRDITERKRSQEELLKSEGRLSKLYESGMLGIFYWNRDGRITDANDKFLEIIGYSRKDMEEGQINGYQMTPPEYRQVDERAVEELSATGVNKVAFEKDYIRKDGTRVPILIAGALLDREHLNGIALVLDITERKQAEFQKEAALEDIRKLNEDLEHRIHERTADLKNSIAQLEEINRVFVGRELKMAELKARIAQLERQNS